MKKINFYTAAAMVLALGMTSCSSDEPINNGDTPISQTASKFVLAVGADKANFLVTADDLTSGKLSTVGNGLTTDAATNWLTWGDSRLLGLVYKQGNPATAMSFFVNAAGKAEKTTVQYDVKRYSTYGLYGDYVLTGAHVNSNLKDEAGRVAKGLEASCLNVKNGELKTVNMPGENFLGNGEYVTFAGFQQSGNMLYTGIIPLGLSVYGSAAEGGKYVKYPDLVAKEDGGEKSSSYKKGELQWTQYPDEAWVAVYDGMNLEGTPTLIKNDKISYPAGRFKSQYYQMIWPDDKGDLYVFSPNFSRIYYTGEEQRSKLPAGVVRIKKGEKKFDDSYYVNLEAQADGHSFLRVWPAGESRFLLQMFSGEMGKNAEGATKLAIFDAATGKLTYVSGLPEEGSYSFVAVVTPLYDNGKVYFPVNMNTGNPRVYVIDVKTATAQAGAEVEGNSLSSISKLTVTQ